MEQTHYTIGISEAILNENGQGLFRVKISHSWQPIFAVASIFESYKYISLYSCKSGLLVARIRDKQVIAEPENIQKIDFFNTDINQLKLF